MPAVNDPAAALSPIAIPANDMEPVACWTLKKIPNPTIP
jgi:hypothetical protein